MSEMGLVSKITFKINMADYVILLLTTVQISTYTVGREYTTPYSLGSCNFDLAIV